MTDSLSAPYDIAVANEQQALPVDESRLEEIVRLTLQAEGVVDATISVAIVDDPTMHALNRRHLDHDYPTDVLSFLLDCVEQRPAATGDDPRRQCEGFGKRLDGEIIISADTALRECREYDWPAEHELTLYLVHGLLHLCGYDDLDDEKRRLMRRREREILQIWGLTPHYVD